MKFSIQRKHIRAMLHLAAKKDIRYYLQGINVVIDNRGTYLQATDGHIMGRLMISEEIKSQNPKNVILPTESLLKVKGTKKQSEEWLHFTVEGMVIECIAGDSTMRFASVDARFPDCDRVLPLVLSSEDAAPSNFNPDLMVRFVDASEELFAKRQVPNLFQRGNSSAVVSFSIDNSFVGVIMPMRDQEPGKVPQWCYVPTVKNEEVTV